MGPRRTPSLSSSLLRKSTLHAAGADVERVVALTSVLDLDDETGKATERLLSLEDDLGHVRSAVKKVSDVALVVVETLSGYLPRIDANATTDSLGAHHHLYLPVGPES